MGQDEGTVGTLGAWLLGQLPLENLAMLKPGHSKCVSVRIGMTAPVGVVRSAFHGIKMSITIPLKLPMTDVPKIKGPHATFQKASFGKRKIWGGKKKKKKT